MLEWNVEARLRQKIKAAGGMCLKWVSPGHTGVPDRIVFLPGGRVFFVELKAPGRVARARQDFVAGELLEQGHKVYLLDTMDKVDAWVDRMVSKREI